MAVERKAWRISKFGTLLLSKDIRDALWCVMRLKIQGTRGPSYYSRERIPLQTVHGWITLLDSDGYVTQDDFDWRFDAQRFLLWSNESYTTTLNQCFIANKQAEVILQELAKKPNTPPLPPSLPPVNYDNFFGRIPILLEGINSISIKTRLDADFDVELIWEPRETSRCSPEPEEFPRGPTPLENSLPEPGKDGQVAPPPYFPPPVFPVNSPPLGGTSFIPPGFPSGQQSSPPNQPPQFPLGATKTTFRIRYQASGFASAGCVLPPPTDVFLGPYTGLFTNGQVSVTPGESDGQTGFACGASRYDKILTLPGVGVLDNILYNGTSGLIFLDPVYS